MEDDARHTGAFRAFDILGGVVDKQTFLGDKLERFVQQTVNLCFRFDQLDIGRNERPVKILTAGNPRPVFVLAVTGVGQQIYAVSRLFQVAYQLLHTGDGEDGTIPPVNQQVRFLVKPLGKTAAHALGCFGLGHGAAIHLRPFQREVDVVQQQLSVRALNAHGVQKIVPVKAQQNVAHVENNVFDHQTILTLPLVARNTMTSETIVVRVRIVARAAAVPSLMRTTS